MKIDCANIQGLRSNFSTVLSHIEINTPDILFLTETQVSKSSRNFQAPSGYRLEHSFALKHGVCVYIRPNLSYARFGKYEINHIHFNSIFLRLSLEHSFIFIIGIYRSPNTPPNVDCFEELSDALCDLYGEYPEAQVFITGDFNVHNTNWLQHSSHTDNAGRSAEFLASTFELQQLVKEPTRIPRNGQFANTLDLVLCSLAEYSSVKVLPPLGSSDHCLISTSLQIAPNLIPTPPPRTVFQYSKANWTKLHEFYSSYPWKLVLSWHNINDVVDSLVSGIKVGIKLYIPTVRIGKSTKMIYSTASKSALRKKHHAYRNYTKQRALYDQDSPIVKEARAELRQISNRCKSIINCENFKFLKQKTDKVLSQPNNPRFFYHTVRSLQSNFVQSSTPPFINNGTTISDPQEKCNLLASIFASNSTTNNPSTPPLFLPRSNHNMKPIIFRKNIVRKYLLALNPHKSTGPDGIPAIILKKFAKVFAPILTKVFVMSYKSGVFPDAWKIANIQPVPKKGGKSDAHNYRPIAIISVLSKIFEKYINWYVLDYAEKSNILSDSQYGFRKGRSTCDALAMLIHEWNTSLEQKGEAYVISLDIAKAFDSVWHANLIAKMHSCGFDSSLSVLLESFLFKRKISVVMGGHISDQFELNAGVPQGSPLASTLFLIYINDLLSCSSNSIHSYADDTTLHAKVAHSSYDSVNQINTTRKSVADSLSDDLQQINSWGTINCMEFNSSKTQLCLLSRKKSRSSPAVIMNNDPLLENESLHLLGVSINENLRWDQHIGNIAKSTAQKLGFLARCRRFFSAEQSLRIYVSMIRPCIEYCSPIWGGAPETHLSMLDRIQRKAVRIINDPKITNSLPSLQHRRDVADLSLFSRYFAGKCSDELKLAMASPKVFNRVSRNSINSHPFVLAEQTCRTTHFQNDFFSRTVIKWNKLPAHVFPSSFASPSSIDVFKRNIHKFLLSNPFPRLSSFSL